LNSYDKERNEVTGKVLDKVMKNKVQSADGKDGKDPLAERIETNQREREDSNRRAKGLLGDIFPNMEKILPKGY
jgi:hypothetical protein